MDELDRTWRYEGNRRLGKDRFRHKHDGQQRKRRRGVS